MARKRRRKKRKGQTAGEGTEPSGPSPEMQQQASKVRRLLSKGEHKSALHQAKQVHKRFGTAESEKLLVDAYVARIEGMLDSGLNVEAHALVDLVRTRHPSSRGRIDALNTVFAARGGMMDDLLRPLTDVELAPKKRAAIDDAIRKEVTDPGALAECDVLPTDHPLRANAAAIVRAFTAVTSGPVEDGDIALSEVSRRSPLAPWKMLIRAVAFFYRHDDEACERCLRMIDLESAPARVAPALRAMQGDDAGVERKSKGSKLVAQVGGSFAALQDALSALDRAFSGHSQSTTLRAVRRVIKECKDTCPDLLERLRQHVSVRSVSAELPPGPVRSALGGASLKNAYFWRLFARDAERKDAVAACSLWEEFRKQAVHEGWFAEDGPETATLYLHMAEQLRRIPEDDLWESLEIFHSRFSGYGHYYADQPPAVRAAASRKHPGKSDTYFWHPEQLYECACAVDPESETFQLWLTWEQENSRHWRPADNVALAWHAALPDDSRPLLYLMESAEKRNAFKKALGHLEEAERRDRLNPDVRKARLRLLLATARRHLKQRKPHLAEKDFEAISALPETQVGDRSAYLAALRWLCAVIDDDAETGALRSADVSRLMGGDLAAIVVMLGTAKACGQYSAKLSHMPPGPALLKPGEVAEAIARACGLGDEMGTPFDIPLGWGKRLAEDLASSECKLDSGQLRTLAETALRRRHDELAYTASGVGLARGGADVARFLLLRGRSLPYWDFRRRNKCLVAAAALARRRRDLDLVDDAVEELRGPGGRWYPASLMGDEIDEQDLSMAPEQINEVVQREQEAKQYATYPPDDMDYDEDDYNDTCDCIECRRKRGELTPEEMFGGFFDDEDDYSDFDDDRTEGSPVDSLPDASLEGMGVLLDILGKYGDIPHPDVLRKKDPELYRRVKEVFSDLDDIFEGFPDLDALPSPDTRRAGRAKRKKRSKRKQR